ncbi:MAG: MerR family transcriptional regulator [Janthinobacterium lividum]
MPPAPSVGKASGAFRTIGEVSRDTGLPAHVLRYWETRFPQLRPVTRAGQRRYYRPEDVALVRRIDELLNTRGHTIRGVQKLLEESDRPAPAPAATASLDAVRRVRDALAAALADD